MILRKDIRIAGERALTPFRTSASFEYRFCKTCGSRIFAYEDSEPDLMYFMPATLDGGAHPGHPPDKESHIHVGSRAVWEHISDDLPKFDGASPDEIATSMTRAGSGEV